MIADSYFIPVISDNCSGLTRKDSVSYLTGKTRVESASVFEGTCRRALWLSNGPIRICALCTTSSIAAVYLCLKPPGCEAGDPMERLIILGIRRCGLVRKSLASPFLGGRGMEHLSFRRWICIYQYFQTRFNYLT